MSNLNAIIEISKLCESNNIDVGIDESGIILSACRNGKSYSKRYELDMLNKIVVNFPLEILIDLFLEETVLNFKKAVG